MKTHFSNLFAEAYKKVISEGGAAGHMAHLWEIDELTFGELKDIFKQLFSGQLEIFEKYDGQNLTITYKDGGVKAARNKATLREPMDVNAVAEKFSELPHVQKAFVKSMEDLESAIETLSEEEIEEIFNGGKNYISLEIIFPETKNVIDYNGKCILQFHGLIKYDDDFNKVGEDPALAKKLFSLLQEKDALNQKTFEISGPTVLKIKNNKKASEALNEVVFELDNVMKRLEVTDETSFSDYIGKVCEKFVSSTAKSSGIEPITEEYTGKLADKINPFYAGAKPKKTELAKLAADSGIDVKSNEYQDFIAEVESKAESIVNNAVEAVEKIVVNAGALLIENLSGFVSADRSASAKKLSSELEAALEEINARKDDPGLSASKVKAIAKNLKKLEEFGKTPTGIEGIVFSWKGKFAKMTANFGVINQLLGLFKYDR